MNTANRRVVIVGGGHAGEAAASSLRRAGWTGGITIVSDEDALPYQRPPLSKRWLLAPLEIDDILLRKSSFFAKKDIEVITNTRVTGINRQRKFVHFESGNHLTYSALILATGSSPILPPIDGRSAKGVFALRSAEDARHLKQALHQSNSVVIIGGGYIGLEVAASARKLGKQVHVLELADRVLQRSASAPVADYLSERHRREGVKIHCGVGAASIETDDGSVSAVTTTDGQRMGCDLVLIGIGAKPNDALARANGLDCNNGIIVNADAQTTDPAIFAIGDVANRPMPRYGISARLESVANANEGAKQAAAKITSAAAPSPEVTWNWSDQYDAKVQTAGLAHEVMHSIIRAQPSGSGFGVFHLSSSLRLQQVEAVNDAETFLVGRKLLQSDAPLDPERLANPQMALSSLVA